MNILKFLFRPIHVGRLFRIPILVMPAVLVIILLLVVLAGQRAGSTGVGWMVMMLGVLAVSLLAHELGHALLARRLGVQVLDITIWPLGGMARLQDMTHRPAIEGAIAVAGPLVNLALAGIAALIPGTIANQAMWLNLILGLGNLVPAFPLDGGRVLRAWLARRAPLVDATRAAVTLSGFAAVALFIGAWAMQAPFLGLVLAIYIWWVGRLELIQVAIRTGRPPSLSVGQVLRCAFSPAPVAKTPDSEPAQKKDGADPQELEQFRGSMSEYFRRRKSSG